MTGTLVVYDPVPEVSAARSLLRRLTGTTPPVIREGTMRSPLRADGLRAELEKTPEAHAVIARNAELPSREAGQGLVTCVAISHPVLLTLRASQRVAAGRLRKEGSEPSDEAVHAHLVQLLTEAKPRYPFASPQAGLLAAEGDTAPRARRVQPADVPAIAQAVEAKADVVLFPDFPLALARGMEMAGKAAGFDWQPARINGAARRAVSYDLVKELESWRDRLGTELFQRVCDVSRGDIALLNQLFTAWKGKLGLKPEGITAIERSLAACGKLTVRRRPASEQPEQAAA